ncbi:hypothetical protein EZ449_08655 [Pedobacter frigidisoli]|uniref:Uncharacterized protein n=1 Tax=Pedobacter frigidisoli TaxID=2530455 RepID=A0A4R0P3Z2_9SPHI|nr:hypothetical protein [Pedobacter frigidisoli]TCD10412.1 hypothetical protein EZ449_08655 [Pedobacter frigidisoli]
MTAYSKLFSVNVRHNYYEDYLCEDLSFVPTQNSSSIMRNQRLLYKAFATGFSLICEVNSEKKPLIKLSETKFQFGISLKLAAKFMAITNLNETTPAKEFLSNKKIYLTNVGLNPDLKYSIIDAVVGDLMSLNFSLAANSEITLRVNSLEKNNLVIAYDTNGGPIPSPYKIKKSDDGTFSKLLDLSKLTDGLYAISIKNAADTGNDLLSFKIFKSNELSAQPNFGVLDIKIPALDAAAVETKFSINFLRKETTWKYYVINQSGIDLDDFGLFVNDKSADGSASGNPVYSNYTFAGIPVPADDTDPINKIADAEIVLFTSNVKIPFFQKVKTGLELSKKDGPTEVVLSKNLPNPTAEKQAGEESRIYIYV